MLLIANNAFAWLDSDDNNQEVPPAIVEASTSNQSSITTNDNVVVITQQQIQKSGAHTVSEVLRNQAGIQLNDLFGDNSQVSVSMRGFGENAASNALILIDGFPLTNPDTAIPELNSIPVQEIERIEIINGSPSVLYGDQAVGGIINIITKQPLIFTTEITANHGSYQQNQGNIFLGDTLKNNFYYTADGDLFGDNNYRDHNNQHTQNALAKVGYAYNTGSVMFRLQRYHDFIQFPGALTAEQMQQDPQQATNNTDFDDELLQQYQAQWLQIINNNWLLQLDLSHNNTAASGFIFSPFIENRTTNQINPRLVATVAKSTLTTGIDIEDDQFLFQSATLQDNDSLQQYGIYGQLLIPFLQKFQATLGARAEDQYSHLNKFVDIQNPENNATVSKASISYQLKPNWRLFASREGNFRFPKVDENAFVPIGTTALQTQTGVSYETGLEWQQLGRDLKLTLYQLNLDNEIAFNPLQTPTQPFGANVNLPPTRRNGIILSSHYSLNKALTLGAEYGYVNAFFMQGQFNGNQIPFVAKNIVNVNANYNFLSYWNCYLEELYTGSRFASGDYQNTNGQIPSYWLTNINLQYQRNHWLFAARINNLFNKRYNTFVVFNPEMTQNFFYPAPGINFMVTAEYQLEVG